jgi:hypothetical protein
VGLEGFSRQCTELQIELKNFFSETEYEEIDVSENKKLPVESLG